MQTSTTDEPVSTKETGRLTPAKRAQFQRARVIAEELSCADEDHVTLEIWEPDIEDVLAGRCWIWMYAGGYEHVLKDLDAALAEAAQVLQQWAICLRRKQQHLMGSVWSSCGEADRLERVAKRIEELL